jgi:SAM-dependent methyltransferase
MIQFRNNRFQDFFEDDMYIIFKNYLYNYLLRRYAVKKSLKNEKQDMILEVGSGISPVVTPGDLVVYSDLSFQALKTLRRNVGKGMYVVADGMKLPFRSDTFSHTISSEVLEHLENDQKALCEIARVIKPSGLLVITFPHRRFYFTYDDRFVGHLRRYELSEMKNRLRDAGLQTIFVRKVLGPLEKITMCVAIFCFSVAQRLRMKEKENVLSPGPRAIFSSLFKWINRLYAGIAWFDANIMPRALSSVLLIKAIKKGSSPN